ncbi:MAG TPA: hypothetical protein VHA09_08855 [Nitrososphaera sp.]|nr:hypothetical protein [Nitrososphaera sp.]
MKEFRVLVTCAVCGETFDSDYKLTKHMSNNHPQPEKTGWVGGGGGESEHSCSCGSGYHSMHGHHHSHQHDE